MTVVTFGLNLICSSYWLHTAIYQDEDPEILLKTHWHVLFAHGFHFLSQIPIYFGQIIAELIDKGHYMTKFYLRFKWITQSTCKCKIQEFLIRQIYIYIHIYIYKTGVHINKAYQSVIHWSGRLCSLKSLKNKLYLTWY